MNSINLQFFGAARQVTGSKHLLTTPKGKKLLLDCGLFQGKIPNGQDLNRHFDFAPYEIDYVILSHAHIDHSGLIPRLVREGFNGKIYCTPATLSLCKIMLQDSAHIQESDLKYVNDRRRKRNEPILDPLYDSEDVSKALKLFEVIEYNKDCILDHEVSFMFTDAGHLLGSACVHLNIKTDKGESKRITFTGDIGCYGRKILKDPEPFGQCDVLICESTYGDRLHPNRSNEEQHLLDIVKRTCVEQLGKLIKPAFSVDRTQEIIYSLDRMANAGLLPHIKVFVDSPLSVKATDEIRRHEECFDEEFIEYIKKDPNPFGFKDLQYISKIEDSKLLNNLKEPCIIISASGMAEAGRIKHHIKNNILNHQNTILFVGYCTPDSLGGRLKAGNKTVRIFGEEYEVKAGIESIEYYSAHGDYEEMLRLLECQDKAKIERIFLVHGEYETQKAFKEKMLERGYNNIDIPDYKEIYNL